MAGVVHKRDRARMDVRTVTSGIVEATLKVSIPLKNVVSNCDVVDVLVAVDPDAHDRNRTARRLDVEVVMREGIAEEVDIVGTLRVAGGRLAGR